MSGGVPVNRQWVLVLTDGSVVIDWGDGQYQDVYEGNFLQLAEEQISHAALDDELEILKRAGRVGSFSRTHVYFANLPDRPLKTLD